MCLPGSPCGATFVIAGGHKGRPYRRPSISPHDQDALERMARYVTRPPLAIGSVSLTPEGKVLISTPPDHQTGETSKLLDPLDFAHMGSGRGHDPFEPRAPPAKKTG